MHKKDFNGWANLKEKIDTDSPVPTFKEREIWWCSIGVNVGHEVDGKNNFYNRPVLVVRKFNARMFWGVPLTTKVKDNPFYFQIHFKGHEAVERKRCVMLSHLRLYDSKRLHDKMGWLARDEFTAVKNALKGLL